MALHTIIIEFTDDPNQIRNEGVGDYLRLPNGNKLVKVYCQDNSEKWRRWAFMCAMHELTEFELCDHRGIKEEDIDKFDAWYLSKGWEGEPGDHAFSVYKKEHRSAEMVERYLAEQFGLDWHEYFNSYLTPEDFKYNEDYGKEN
jgi:hypothetical protein